MAVYTTLASELRGRRVVHWIDNTSALCALVRGYSRAPDSVRIVHAFHAFALGIDVSSWFEYVASKANIADLPSRGEFDWVHERFGSEWVDTTLPDVAKWDECAWEWCQAAASVPAGAHTDGGRRRRRHR